MSCSTPNVFLCNGAGRPKDLAKTAKVTSLIYFRNDPDCNVNLQLPRFVDQVFHLPLRILDLLEIAAYIFAADRAAQRGAKEAVELHAWPRDMHFVIRVRDVDFWNQTSVKQKLSAALLFMTGDRDYLFDFVPGHSTPPTSLFDREEFAIAPKEPSSVALFSGGSDSLAGVLERLESTNEVLYLISHRSGQPSTKRTQKKLVDALTAEYPRRIRHYSFDCGLSHIRAAEETQRTRAFLFCSIAFSLAHRLSLDSFFAYENGVTSLNLLRRQDLISARASRTTHPKTFHLMSQFLSELNGSRFTVLNPFWNKTKTDVMDLLSRVNGRNLISSTVSCSKTFQRLETATHCGSCFQCIDRRLAAYAAGLQDVDNVGIYSKDIFTDPIESPETRTTALDYIRQAVCFSKETDDAFALARLSELADITDYVPGNEDEAVEAVWQLCHRHGEQVLVALTDIRRHLDDLRYKVRSGSLLQLISDREYLKEDPERLAGQIAAMLRENIPVAFRKTKPKNENEVNDQIDALLRAHGDDFKREFPTTTFCLAKVVPDHEAKAAALIVEAKYIRKATTPSKASEGIAADITKYPLGSFILFVVYDPERAIVDDGTFEMDIQSKRDCLVTVIR
ncbi:MAG: 7-cyano-7-deazaguanine synthase [Thermodesulfobacteriota bacterium]|jgi:7-cyano-7-deazaguanine synthase in queuosine biosynthesis|nr:MAG: 7-cyano-7-deazaguanine synthase [Thermodesulfobacteriota bacterium]